MVSLARKPISRNAPGGVFPNDRGPVTVDAFQIAKYETTWQLWKEVYDWAKLNGYFFQNPGREGHGMDGTGQASVGTADSRATRPVTRISWRDAIVWCNAYSQMNGLEPVYSYRGSFIKDSRDTNATALTNVDMGITSSGYRLPTEAEWEYAARGEYLSVLSWNYAYAGSSTINDVAWFAGNSAYSGDDTSNAGHGAHPVGSKPANNIGLYDMSGNVAEWCWDWYSNPLTMTTPITGAATGTDRVIRGGGWNSESDYCKVDARSYSSGAADSGIGFRVVCR
jgi:formylglycine-generating enzyme required for sulfatase activity